MMMKPSLSRGETRAAGDSGDRRRRTSKGIHVCMMSPFAPRLLDPQISGEVYRVTRGVLELHQRFPDISIHEELAAADLTVGTPIVNCFPVSVSDGENELGHCGGQTVSDLSGAVQRGSTSFIEATVDRSVASYLDSATQDRRLERDASGCLRAVVLSHFDLKIRNQRKPALKRRRSTDSDDDDDDEDDDLDEAEHSDGDGDGDAADEGEDPINTSPSPAAPAMDGLASSLPIEAESQRNLVSVSFPRHINRHEAMNRCIVVPVVDVVREAEGGGVAVERCLLTLREIVDESQLAELERRLDSAAIEAPDRVDLACSKAVREWHRSLLEERFDSDMGSVRRKIGNSTMAWRGKDFGVRRLSTTECFMGAEIADAATMDALCSDEGGDALASTVTRTLESLFGPDCFDSFQDCAVDVEPLLQLRYLRFGITSLIDSADEAERIAAKLKKRLEVSTCLGGKQMVDETKIRQLTDEYVEYARQKRGCSAIEPPTEYRTTVVVARFHVRSNAASGGGGGGGGAEVPDFVVVRHGSDTGRSSPGATPQISSASTVRRRLQVFRVMCRGFHQHHLTRASPLGVCHLRCTLADFERAIIVAHVSEIVRVQLVSRLAVVLRDRAAFRVVKAKFQAFRNSVEVRCKSARTAERLRGASPSPASAWTAANRDTEEPVETGRRGHWTSHLSHHDIVNAVNEIRQWIRLNCLEWHKSLFRAVLTLLDDDNRHDDDPALLLRQLIQAPLCCPTKRHLGLQLAKLRCFYRCTPEDLFPVGQIRRDLVGVCGISPAESRELIHQMYADVSSVQSTDRDIFVALQLPPEVRQSSDGHSDGEVYDEV